MAITTIEDAQAWFPGVDPGELRDAWAAAEEWVSARVRWPGMTSTPPATPPKALVQAVRLQTARLLQRRNSPEGVVGMDADGLGAVRLPREDVDVISLIGPWRPVIFS